MNGLREWWSQPTDYVWNVTYAQSQPMLRPTRIAIGICCWTYGLICILALMTPLLPPHSIGQWVVGVFAASTTVVGAIWIRGPWLDHRRSLLFVAYAEIGVTGVLISLGDPAVALQSAVLLAVMGNYVSAFHDTRVFVAHQAWALATCGFLYLRAIPDADQTIARISAYLVVLVLVLVSSPVLTQSYLSYLRRDAAVAHFDPLTGLRNRRGFEAAVVSTSEDVKGIAVVVTDLDNFKSVNDNFGHSYGDQVLRSTAEALQRVFGAPAVTARTGGEEFVVLTTATVAEATVAAERLRHEIPRCDPNGGTTASIGIHYRRLPARQIQGRLDELLHAADMAMYRAKRRGGNSIVVDDGGQEITAPSS